MVSLAIGRRHGFALVDVIVGAILIGVSLAVIIGLTGRALSSQKRGEELTVAATLADEALQLVLARGPDDYAKRFPVEGACEPPFSAYRYQIDISAGTTTVPYHVTATITWGGGSGVPPQSIVIETLMASRDGGLDEIGGQSDPLRTPESPVIRIP
jgi:type II secretory pathway pseudopilin PulG